MQYLLQLRIKRWREGRKDFDRWMLTRLHTDSGRCYGSSSGWCWSLFRYGSYLKSARRSLLQILIRKKIGRSPTKSTSEAPVGMAKEGMPWETGATEGKYRYHPGGDPDAAPKDAPSAVNVVVIPDVNLPKVCLIPCAIMRPSTRRISSTRKRRKISTSANFVL